MRFREIAMGVALAAGTLAVAEALCRAGGWFTAPAARSGLLPGRLKPMLAGSRELGWVLRPGSSGILEDEDAFPRAFDSDGFNVLDSEQVRDETTPKVLFIGGSDAFGYGVPADRNFVEIADGLLQGVHAINLGVPGYSSAQGVLVASKFIPSLRPRIAVFSFGFNDRRDAQDRLPDGPEQFAAIYRTSAEYLPNRLRRFFTWSHLLRGLDSLTRSREAPRPRGPFPLANARPRVDVARYEANLEAMIDVCVKHGVIPLLLLLPDSPKEVGRLHEAEALMEAGDPGAAIPILRDLLDGPTEYNVVRLTLARAYRSLGRNAEAAASIATPVEFPDPPIDGMDPVVSDTEYARAMRRVAVRRSVALIDGAGIVGQMPEAFIDEAHLSETGHRLIARELAVRVTASPGGSVR